MTERHYLFSRSLAAQCEVGKKFPNVPEMFPDFFTSDFVPTVGEKLSVIAPGVAAYRELGTKWTHYTLDSEGAITGVVLRVDGPPSDMKTFFAGLDKLDATFGLHRRNREFIRYKPRGFLAVILADIYIADSVESLKNAEAVKGDLQRVD